MDIVEGHGERGEGQHHPFLHIALLEAVASLTHAAAGTLQLLCRQPSSLERASEYAGRFGGLPC